ncbi:uridylate kinase [Rhodoligotrophos appendicifer]|uniref:UMP kinase n=1 Tax=Rhodoligotrophos appendicifer TaxID=987056 RepID=UPI001184C3CA|nr:UMP kinase [Rhodoligotrophos appendicifer]
MVNPRPPFRRVLLKLSGEALMGDQSYGIDMAVADRVAAEIRDIVDLGVELCIVVGGGNIFRGLAGAAQGMDRANADHIGMLATIMNALALNNALGHAGVDSRVMSAIPMPTVCESYIRPRALRHLSKGRVLIFAAGTGNPYFTTDTAAALRAAEMGCTALFKGTSVDGVYAADPKKQPDAERYDSLTYQDVLARDLRVMDSAAVTLARDNDISVIVFSIRTPGSLGAVMRGQGRCTVIGTAGVAGNRE